MRAMLAAALEFPEQHFFIELVIPIRIAQPVEAAGSAIAAPSLLSLKKDPAFEKVLKSQAISKRAFAKLEEKDYAGFIKQRAADLVARAKELTKT